MRRHLIMLLSVLALAVVLPACAATEGEPTEVPTVSVAVVPTAASTEVAAEDTDEEAEDSETTDEVSTEGSGLIDTDWTCPKEFAGQTLSVYNWATYIGDQTIATFEALCDVQVVYDVYDSDEALISRIQQGNPGYDIGFPTNFAVALMIREDLVEPINLENIPNFENIGDTFIDQGFDPGNQYSVPYLWGTTGIGYNVNNVDEPITSWEQIFTTDARVGWYSSPRTMFSIALLILGLDPNSTNPEDIEAAKNYLIENSDNLIVIAEDDGDSLLVQGEIDVVVEFGGDMYQQIVDCACEDYAFVNPEEGAILDITSMVVLKDAPNQDLAEVFLDYMSDPAVAAHSTNTLLYPSPNTVAIEQGLINAEILANAALNPSPEAQEPMFFMTDVGEADQLYNEAWDEVSVLVGR